MHNSSSKLPSPLEIGSSFLCLFLMFTQGSLLSESQNPDSMHPLLFRGFLHKGLTNWLHLETWWGELFHGDLRQQQLTIPPWVCRCPVMSTDSPGSRNVWWTGATTRDCRFVTLPCKSHQGQVWSFLLTPERRYRLIAALLDASDVSVQ